MNENEREIEIENINKTLKALREEDVRLARIQQYCIYFCLFCLFLAVLVTLVAN